MVFVVQEIFWEYSENKFNLLLGQKCSKSFEAKKYSAELFIFEITQDLSANIFYAIKK